MLLGVDLVLRVGKYWYKSPLVSYSSSSGRSQIVFLFFNLSSPTRHALKILRNERVKYQMEQDWHSNTENM